MTQEQRGDASRDDHPDVRPRPLEYERAFPFAEGKRFGWKDVAVIVFILLGPILLWILQHLVRF